MLPAAAGAESFVLAVVAVPAAMRSQSGLREGFGGTSYLLIPLISAKFVRLLLLLRWRLLFLLLLVFCARRQIHLRVHLLYLRKIAVHEVAEQDLRIQRASRVCKLDVCHAIDGPFFQDREPGPAVIDVGLEFTIPWLGR